jgi:hypothetical protein
MPTSLAQALAAMRADFSIVRRAIIIVDGYLLALQVSYTEYLVII